MREREAVRIREFATGGADAASFRALNEEWIVRHFSLEPRDVETLGDPERTILGIGGRILMVEADGTAVGCVALIPMAEGVVELSKMAVAPAMRGGVWGGSCWDGRSKRRGRWGRGGCF